jgi:hypothetical protein
MIAEELVQKFTSPTSGGIHINEIKLGCQRCLYLGLKEVESVSLGLPLREHWSSRTP